MRGIFMNAHTEWIVVRAFARTPARSKKPGGGRRRAKGKGRAH